MLPEANANTAARDESLRRVPFYALVFITAYVASPVPGYSPVVLTEFRHRFIARYSLRIPTWVFRSTGWNPAPDNADRMEAGGTHSAMVAQ